MSVLPEIRERLRALFFRNREDRELEEELRYHLEMTVEENLRRGMDVEEARRQAALELGGLTQTREAARNDRGLRSLERIAQDIRYGLRGVRSNPLFATALVLTLGLGIGANATMFSVIDALLLRPLPYPEPDRLVEIWEANPETGRRQEAMPLDVGRVWAERDDLFETAFPYTWLTVLYTGGAEPTTVGAGAVSPGWDETLGIGPVLGRNFTEEDAHPAAESTVLLSHGFWLQAFGADPAVLGRVIELDGIDHRIIGVMPEGFKFPTYASTEVWTALRQDGRYFGQPGRPVYMLARLPVDVSIAAAQARADDLAASLVDAMPRDGDWSVHLRPLDAVRGGDSTRRAIWFLAGAVGLILLVAMLNGVNLLLVRGWSRTRELAVRVALGASRRRLVGQLLTESLMLALAAGIVAVLLAFVALRLIEGIIPSDVTFWTPYDIALERRPLLFAFGAAVVTGLGIGVTTALLATRTRTGSAEAGLTTYAAKTLAQVHLRRGLVIAEVAVSVALLTGAGLLLNSFVRLMRVDPGFRLENVAIMTLSLSPGAHPTGETRMAFMRGLEARIESIPGVAGATTGGTGLPVYGFSLSSLLETDDGLDRSQSNPRLIAYTRVSPDFFGLLDVPVLTGRPLTDADRGTENVIVDIELARFLWGDANPIGRRFLVSRRD